MKKMIVHNEAELELWNAVEYYESKKSGLGLDLEKEISQALISIQENPQMWPKRNYGTRVCLLKRFPYAIYYLEFVDEIWILAFAHTSRKPYYWLNRI